LLQNLVLAGNNLDSLALQQLVKGAWPQLQRLDLGYNCISSADIACLGNGNEPLVCLGQNCFDPPTSLFGRRWSCLQAVILGNCQS